MAVKNKEVAEAWRTGQSATNHRKSFYCLDDGSLWSYNLKIGQRTPSGFCLMANYTAGGEFRSQTTSCHIGVARVVAHQVWHPKVWDVSRFSQKLPF
jgi:hypothetical protein